MAWWNGFFEWKQIPQDFLLNHVLIPWFSEHGTETVNRMLHLTPTECRAEIITFAHDLEAGEDPQAAANFFRRLKEMQQPVRPYQHGDENKYIAVLGGYWGAMSETPENREKRREVIKTLWGIANEEEHRVRFEAMVHDPVFQNLRRAAAKVDHQLGELADWVENNLPAPAPPGWRRIFRG